MNARTESTAMTPHKTALLGIDKLRDTLQGSLPPDVSVDKFTSVVKTALNTNVDLIEADRQSLYNECVRAAQDGLLPDGREGALVIFKVNKGTQSSPKWVKTVKWMPMIGGLRKKAAKHGYDLIAQVIYANDRFDFQLGDDPKIVHTPTPLNEKAGEIVGAYAIATELKSGRKYREVMSKIEIDDVRSVSKSKDSGPWVTWYSEQARKTVCRRLFKQLPFYMEDDIQKIISTDNEDYQFTDTGTEPESVAPAPTGSKARDKILADNDKSVVSTQGNEAAAEGGNDDII